MPNLQRQQQQQDRTRHPVRHLRGPPDADAKQMEQEAMTPTQRAAMEQALADMMSFEAGTGGLYRGEFAESIAALSAALAEQPAEQEKLAIMQRIVDSNTGFIRNPTTPQTAKPTQNICPTCESLARSVMLDQTGRA